MTIPSVFGNMRPMKTLVPVVGHASHSLDAPRMPLAPTHTPVTHGIWERFRQAATRYAWEPARLEPRGNLALQPVARAPTPAAIKFG